MVVILGVCTRLAAFAIGIDLTVAIAKLHWKSGLRGNGGYQFPLALAAIAFALSSSVQGPSLWSQFVAAGAASRRPPERVTLRFVIASGTRFLPPTIKTTAFPHGGHPGPRNCDHDRMAPGARR
jgi:hypothetical protein